MKKVIKVWTERSLYDRICDFREYKIEIDYKLSYLRGNKLPYFSVTGTVYSRKNGRGRWAWNSAGCIHDEIQKHTKDYNDLIAFHLRDLYGSPMHDLDNGLYHLGFTKWQGVNLEAVKEHFLLKDLDEARALKLEFDGVFGRTGGDLEKVKEAVKEYLDRQKVRYWNEAIRLIKKYNLTVIGER